MSIQGLVAVAVRVAPLRLLNRDGHAHGYWRRRRLGTKKAIQVFEQAPQSLCQIVQYVPLLLCHNHHLSHAVWQVRQGPAV